MPVDKLRAFGKGMARKEVLKIEHFLFLVIDKIQHLELSENDARNLSFVYHRLWWFRKHLIETCLSVPLMIASGLGKLVDHGLIDGDPLGGTKFFADVVLQVFRSLNNAHDVVTLSI